jgi:hypothetical protein
MTPPPPAATATLQAAMTPSRSLLFYTLTASIPLIVIGLMLLLTRISDTWFMALGTIGFVVSVVGLGRLMYEMTLDVAGYPEYKLPVWSVAYLIVYLVSAFAFLFFALHSSAPGRYFTGVRSGAKAAYLDSLYMSLCNYIGVSPDASISIRSPTTRFLSVGEGILAMFINVVIITKFVSTF